jgi:two-component system, sensor histidine kinase and response regulator
MRASHTYHATLLVVDDIPTNLKVLLAHLHNQNFRILVAHDGEDGLHKAEQYSPDLILLDIMMPRMDGFEVCRRLKQNPLTVEIPVIFMTALTDTADKLKGFSVGGVDYVTKPVQHEEVLARINTHLTLRRLQKTLAQQSEETNLFAQTMVNDLKNPLLHLSQLSEQLSTALPEQDSPIYSMSNEIGKTTHDMLNIVNSLLLLISVRTATIPREKLDMGAIVTTVCQRLHAMINHHHAEINLPSHWPLVLGYAPWLEEIWLNYISNAIKYGGRPPIVNINAASDSDNPDFIRFSVSDNGGGIAKSQQEDLFSPQPRFALDKADYGLGLSIVQRMVRKSGGEVGIHSELGNGCVFYFTLPAVATYPNIKAE